MRAHVFCSRSCSRSCCKFKRASDCRAFIYTQILKRIQIDWSIRYQKANTAREWIVRSLMYQWHMSSGCMHCAHFCVAHVGVWFTIFVRLISIIRLLNELENAAWAFSVQFECMRQLFLQWSIRVFSSNNFFFFWFRKSKTII